MLTCHPYSFLGGHVVRSFVPFYWIINFIGLSSSHFNQSGSQPLFRDSKSERWCVKPWVPESSRYILYCGSVLHLILELMLLLPLSCLGGPGPGAEAELSTWSLHPRSRVSDTCFQAFLGATPAHWTQAAFRWSLPSYWAQASEFTSEFWLLILNVLSWLPIFPFHPGPVLPVTSLTRPKDASTTSNIVWRQSPLVFHYVSFSVFNSLKKPTYFFYLPEILTQPSSRSDAPVSHPNPTIISGPIRISFAL